MSGGEWVPFAVVGFIGAAVWAGSAISGRRRRCFDRLAERLQGESGGNGFFRNFYFRGRYKGRPLYVRYYPGGRSSPSSLEFTLADPLFLFDLEITPENGLEKALDYLGLTGDLRAGEPGFDGRFRVSSSVTDLAGRYLADPATRARIGSLFDAGASRLRLEPRGATIPGLISFSLRDPDLELALDLQRLAPLLDLLDQLSSPRLGAELFGAPPPGPGRGRA